MKQEKPIKRKTIVVTEEWKKELERFDYKSKSKYNWFTICFLDRRGAQSILIKQGVKPYGKRDEKKKAELIVLPLDSESLRIPRDAVAKSP